MYPLKSSDPKHEDPGAQIQRSHLREASAFAEEPPYERVDCQHLSCKSARSKPEELEQGLGLRVSEWGSEVQSRFPRGQSDRLGA